MAFILNWPWRFCGMCAITISLAGIIYYKNCRASYGETMEQKIVEIEPFL